MTDIDRPAVPEASDPAPTLPLAAVPAAPASAAPPAPVQGAPALGAPVPGASAQGLPAQGTPAARGAAPATEPAAAGTDVDQVAAAVLARIQDKLASPREAAEMPSVDQAVALREQAPELYDLWLKIAQEKAATASYIDRAPYEVPERLAQSGRPRALGALIVVLSFCGYLAWLGGPGPYIGGLIAILDLGAMFGMFFGLRPDRLSEPGRLDRKRLGEPGPASAPASSPAPGAPEPTTATEPISSPALATSVLAAPEMAASAQAAPAPGASQGASARSADAMTGERGRQVGDELEQVGAGQRVLAPVPRVTGRRRPRIFEYRGAPGVHGRRRGRTSGIEGNGDELLALDHARRPEA
jgi:hypothetical protein